MPQAKPTDMHSDWLFVNVMNDLQGVIDAPDNYKILKAAAEVRQLLMDGDRLAHIVNREYRVPLEFEICDDWETDFLKMLSQSVDFLTVLDGIYPESNLMKTTPVKVSFDRFLSHRVILFQGQYITVADVIRNLANVRGGVHLGTAKKEPDKAFEGMNMFRIGDAEVAIAQFLPIIRVVVKALSPLKQAVLEKHGHRPG